MLSEDDVAALIESMRARNELTFKSEDELRDALQHIDRSELIDIIVAYWDRAKSIN